MLSGVNAGDLKILAILGEKRSSLFPDVPTAEELGYNVNVMAWGGFALPKGTPKEIYDTIASAFWEALETETFQKVMEERGIEVSPLDGPAFREFAIQQFEMYMELIPRALGQQQ